MRYVSTRGGAPAVGLGEAIRRGVAPDGGLYVPEVAPALRPEVRSRLARGAPFGDLAFEVVSPFVGDAVAPAELRRLLGGALDFPIPLVEAAPGRFLLELFHGPTLAFKDVGARTLARLLAATRTGSEELTVLVATSGDTGGAVAAAFHRVAGTRVVVLYPEGKVSPLQERQLATLGDNVAALAVDGTFDSCQQLVREAFADPALVEAAGLTSANSINVGRLIPQVVYHALALARLERPLVVVPSGNFGNLTAGLYAHRLGFAAERFVAATNRNDVVPEYLETGAYRPRPSVRTPSNAMDVGAPSNLERIRHLHGDDVASMRREISGSAWSDEETLAAIARVRKETGRLLDPHTAVGWLALDEALRAGAGGPGVVLATAHPAKFREEVEAVLGEPIELPDALAELLDRPLERRPVPAELDAIRPWLLGRA